jgi:hypothetical protein
MKKIGRGAALFEADFDKLPQVILITFANTFWDITLRPDSSFYPILRLLASYKKPQFGILQKIRLLL